MNMIKTCKCIERKSLRTRSFVPHLVETPSQVSCHRVQGYGNRLLDLRHDLVKEGVVLSENAELRSCCVCVPQFPQINTFVIHMEYMFSYVKHFKIFSNKC